MIALSCEYLVLSLALVSRCCILKMICVIVDILVMLL